MRLNEITDEDKVYMGYKGIKYSFSQELISIKEFLRVISTSMPPFMQAAIIKTHTNKLKQDIEKFIRECELQNIPDLNNDTDISSARKVYNELLELRGEK